MSDATAAGNTATPGDTNVQRWIKEIELYESKAAQWETKAKKILRRYKDERNAREGRESRFNILWSNIQTLLPALFSRNPKPDFQRRFLDADPVGRVACEILERATTFTLDKEDFHLTARQCVMDRLLPGRGTLWVRYVPHFTEVETQMLGNEQIANEGFQIDDDADGNETPDNPVQHTADGQVIEELDYEEIDLDYVHWSDFGHTIARTWQEVRGVWRKCYLTRAELVKRFGEEVGRMVPLDYKPEDLKGQEVSEYQQKACIYEIWDKTTKRVMWLSKSYPMQMLDERDDMLGLQNFFPCPRPMLPNLANDSIIPVPDYAMYQDQAHQLDDLTTRISLLTDAVKVAGAYDNSAPALGQLLAGGYENRLVPVDQWAAFAEKGGMKGAIAFLPMEEIATTITTLYEAREKVKADLYEITGMADIIRGASDPSETATAQTIKSNFASIRLDDMQAEVQRFARDTVVMIAEVLANQFDIKTLAEISGYALMTQQEKQIAKEIQRLGGELPDDMEKPFLEPTWEEVAELLHNANMRHFRLDIETDSTLKMDQVQEKADRTEFLKAISGFVHDAQGADPAIMPLLGQLLMFAVRAFSVGKQMEACLQETVDALQKRAKQAQDNPPPNPAQIKAQTDIEIAQAKNQSDLQQNLAEIQARERAEAADRAMQAQANAEERQAQMVADRARLAMEGHLEQMRAANEAELERQRTFFEGQMKLLLGRLDAMTKIQVAEIGAGATIDAAQISAASAATNSEA